MIELPEAIVLAKQIKETLINKTVYRVLPPTKLHKFCWFNNDPIDYNDQIKNQKIVTALYFGIYVEIVFENNLKLYINDGVNLNYIIDNNIPKDYQLLIEFTDNTKLVFTVAMYGGIVLHDENYKNDYYQKSLEYTSPFSIEFRELYYKQLAICKPTLSLKAFLATEQRFPGIGNGVLQDILFYAGMHPKRKISTLNDEEKEFLLNTIINTLQNMVDLGGRNTETNLFNKPGTYKTRLSKLNTSKTCPKCNGQIIKEAYLGGSIYYCPNCQK